MKKIREKLTAFISNGKDYPILAGFVAGFYILLFYYSNNYDLANSLELFLFFVSYFVVLPVAVCYLSYRIIKATKYSRYARQLLFVAMLSFFIFFILRHMYLGTHYRRVFLVCFLGIAFVSTRFNNYKIAIVLIGIMSLFPSLKLSVALARNFSHDSSWTNQPDAITDCKFTKKPNVYFLQVDGYTSARALKSNLYAYDNSAADLWLKEQGFSLYDNFRSNYNSTLKSNASCFNMKHHYFNESTLLKDSRDYIVGENPVLTVFRNNGYHSVFLTERPYLLMNRPELAFDYCNFKMSDLPYLKDGMTENHDIADELKAQVLANGKSGNFYFVEKFDPSHISVTEVSSLGKAEERLRYLRQLQIANVWLKDIISFINTNDETAIIIVGADHGGFVGFDYTQQVMDNITDVDLLYSVFGARMAIKWNDPKHKLYDRKLETSVNLFRVVFSFLGENPEYLDHLQPDISYNSFDKGGRLHIYPAIK